MQKLNKFIFILLLVKTLDICSEGFTAGTLIKTPNGYTQIEKLKEGDLVISYDFVNSNLVHDRIIGIKKEKVKRIIHLTINNQIIEVDANHKFYSPMTNKRWVKSKELIQNNFLLKNVSQLIRIDGIKEVEKEAEVYTLSIKNNHNFFVSEQDILVHNVILAAWALGEGFKIIWGEELVSFGLGLLISYIAKQNGIDTHFYNPFKIDRPDQNKMKNHIIKPPKHNFDGMDPDHCWELMELTLFVAIKNKELRDGCEFIATHYFTNLGNLVVQGKVIDNVVKVGTAFIEKIF